MTVAFLHSYELTVSSPATLLADTQNTETAAPAPSTLTANEASTVVTGDTSSGYSDYATATVNAITISQLQIEADILYNISPKGKGSQPATIKIYNLSQTNINLITAQSSVILKAGYAPQKTLPAVYIGQVTQVYTRQVGPDIVTTLICGDSKNIIKNAQYNKTYVKGTTYGSILKDLLNQFSDKGAPLGEFTEGERTAKAIGRALTREGSLASSLSAVCNEIDYVWYVTLGKVNVHPKEKSGFIETVDILESNVKGVISLHDDKSGVPTFSKEAKPQGVKLTTFLNGNITTNTTLNIKFGPFKGSYKITSVSHSLNFRGEAWDTDIECQRISE